MVGKTFKGLTDELLAWQTERFLELATERATGWSTSGPSRWWRSPLDGVQASTRYPGGVALRFARVRRYRDDKGPDEADTIEAVGLAPRPLTIQPVRSAISEAKASKRRRASWAGERP